MIATKYPGNPKVSKFCSNNGSNSDLISKPVKLTEIMEEKVIIEEESQRNGDIKRKNKI